MPPKSRFARTIESSKQIAKAAAILRGVKPESSQVESQVAISSALGQLKAAAVGLEAVIEQCNLARGMYLGNPTIRNTIVGAGEYLSERAPKLADLIAKLSSPDAELPPIISALTELALSIASVQFDPSLTVQA